MILRMARVEVLGPRHLLERTIRLLQARGVLELRAAAAPGAPTVHPVAGEGAREEEARLEEALRRIDALSARLPAVRGAPEETLPPPGTDGFTAALAALERDLRALEVRRAALLGERVALRRFTHLLVALAPLGAGLDPAVEPEVFAVALRGDGAAAAPLLEAEVRRLTGGFCEVKQRALDPDTTGVLVVVPRAHAVAVSALLAEREVDEVRLPPEYARKRLAAVLLLLASRERSLPGELARADAALATFAARAARSLAAARAGAAAALDRSRAVAACGETRFAFVITGYVPEEQVEALRAAAIAELGDGVAVLARAPTRAECDDVPVVLRNGPLVRPFQRLLGLVPLPRYGSVDPTPWLAVFFPVFFGVVLGDVAFGAAGAVAALVVWRAGWGGAVGRDVAKVALWCSLSAAAFGVLFGEALGELGVHVGLHPLLLERRTGFMALLGLTLAVGAVHVATGMILGARSAARAGHRREMIGRIAKLLVLAAGAAAAGAVLGVVPRGALVPLVAAGGALLLTALVAEGPLALLDLVVGVGNVLSYSRLMALGLASVMLAEVANHVATTLEPAALGVALGVLLHAVNFTLGLVSPTIAALRLQYVEFFEKFYDAGGRAYRPLALSG